MVARKHLSRTWLTVRALAVRLSFQAETSAPCGWGVCVLLRSAHVHMAQPLISVIGPYSGPTALEAGDASVYKTD